MYHKVKNKTIKSYCGCHAWFNKETEETSIFFCGLASCGREYCQKLYYLKRMRLTTDLILEYGLNRFFTLTMGREIPFEASWEIIPKVWNKALTMLRRKYPGLLFMAILEAHKDSYPHIHGFVDTWIPQKVWSHIFQACGGGKIAHVEKINVKDGNMSAYVNKNLNISLYIGKNQIIDARDIMKPRARLFYRSRNMKTKYENERMNAKSDMVLVWEDIYKKTKNGFDKLFDISYNREYNCLMLRRVLKERVK